MPHLGGRSHGGRKFGAARRPGGDCIDTVSRDSLYPGPCPRTVMGNGETHVAAGGWYADLKRRGRRLPVRREAAE